MLVRPRERHFVDQATSSLRYHVMDELHTYRGGRVPMWRC